MSNGLTRRRKVNARCLPPLVTSCDSDHCRSGSHGAGCQKELLGQSGTKGVDLTATVGGKWRELVRFGQGISTFSKLAL